ncbi:MAG TPA: type II toxin-antitoxin system PemK/MazF family toxin [Oculatellaceae cyanobacterium]
MTSINAGEFWVANIPFITGNTSKKRPVLILWLDGEDAVCAVVTSAQPRTVTDVLLQDWSSSGLRVASTVRLSRLDCLEKSLFLGKVGTISETDAQQIKMIWDTYIKPQF